MNDRAKFETVIKEYKDPKAYKRGAKKMARQGWVVASVENFQENRGCFSIGCLAVIFLPLIFWKKRPQIIVTYSRQIG